MAPGYPMWRYLISRSVPTVTSARRRTGVDFTKLHWRRDVIPLLRRGKAAILQFFSFAVGSDEVFHAFWTDSNNVQTVDWFGGVEWAPGVNVNQQDVVDSDSF